MICGHIATWYISAEGMLIELEKCRMLNITIYMTVRLYAAERKLHGPAAAKNGVVGNDEEKKENSHENSILKSSQQMRQTMRNQCKSHVQSLTDQ